jgi:hypothetical protein
VRAPNKDDANPVVGVPPVAADRAAPTSGSRAADARRVRQPELPGPRRRISDREAVLAAEVQVETDGKSETWHLLATNVGLSWGVGEHPLVVPWAAIRRARVEADDIVVVYAWPYVLDGEKTIRTRVGSISAYLFSEEIERRMKALTVARRTGRADA